MENTVNKLTVMFADVSGSTRLYDTLGDQQANAIISEMIQIMSDITVEHGGAVIKTIGDEVMCRFYRVDDAIIAARDIQQNIDNHPSFREHGVGVHIGLHWGPAIIKQDGDLFGDAVNIAARMTGIAKARQIITTEPTARQLSAELRENSREIDRASVKGKAEDIVIYEFIWEPEDTTRLSLPNINLNKETSPLVVQFGELRKKVSEQTPILSFGRSDLADITVNTDLASRQHARIEYRRGKYILVDQSTNGTFVRTDNGREVYLRKEEMQLQGRGIISLGEEIQLNTPYLIHFKI